MPNGPLLSRIDERVFRDKEEGDLTYCSVLSLKLEYLTKLITLATLACVEPDPERNRYRLEHQLIRADGIGDWTKVLQEILTGRPAQFITNNARSHTNALNERVGPQDPRHQAVLSMRDACAAVGLAEGLGGKVALRQLLDLGVAFRNHTRGHGATTIDQASEACPHLAAAVHGLQESTPFFQLQWAHLHRNLSGKYRVTDLLNGSTSFDRLKSESQHRLDNGVYLFLNRPIRVPLIYFDSGALDIFLPNGNYRSSPRKFQVLSYVRNLREDESSEKWSAPPTALPPSSTEGPNELEDLGERSLSNLPPEPRYYVSRPYHEKVLIDELLIHDRHPIVTLTGPGGIGKTSIAIRALHQMAKDGTMPYELVLWISARDIDLLQHGPKSVSPRVVSRRDIVRAIAAIMDEPLSHTATAEEYFQGILQESPLSGPTLFVFDNFETLDNPADVYAWLETYIRLPNKALITTRSRDFSADFPLDIGGMTDPEAEELIDGHSKRLGIQTLVTKKYRTTLVRETGGHPYVINMLLGRVAAQKQARMPKKIVADADGLLRALFERTYSSLSPAAQQIFLLLSSWHVVVPELAVEAVLLWASDQVIGVSRALDELKAYSMVQESREDGSDESHVSVALAAAVFGARKLEVSPHRYIVEKARPVLMEFGPGRHGGWKGGLTLQLRRVVRKIEQKARVEPAILDQRLPMLEFLARRIPALYEDLAALVLQLRGPGLATGQAQEYLRLSMEDAAAVGDSDRLGELWFKMERLCHETGDIAGEVEALTEGAMASATGGRGRALSQAANRLNSRLASPRVRNSPVIQGTEVRARLERFVAEMDRDTEAFAANDCSRLAWLHWRLGNRDRACDLTELGLRQDPNHQHCLNLAQRLRIL